jgi:hypothetical protein
MHAASDLPMCPRMRDRCNRAGVWIAPPHTKTCRNVMLPVRPPANVVMARRAIPPPVSRLSMRQPVTRRAPLPALNAGKNALIPAGTFDKADGIAFDAVGNVYIGFGDGISRVSPDGKTIKKLARGRTANVEFGAGAIPATDLYAVTDRKLVRFANDVAGAAVPWHVAGP